MEVQEYCYLKKIEDDYEFTCRYCDSPLIYDIKFGPNNTRKKIQNRISMFEEEAIFHLMMCDKFNQIRKQEIEESCDI